mmetsp:Transcript_29732/g.39550  ORF Transcript_29732/g.39550 Transcript_29732/m.39550 type:complete len:195 (+) Transcript_29732:130-714(+)
MLFEVLQVIALQVEDYLDKDVTLGNIALLDESNNGAIEDTILLTLINMSEENTMKNFKNIRTVGNVTQIKQPVINLNLYILFSVNRGIGSYDEELADLSGIVEFFQGKKVFTQSNTIYNHSTNEMNPLSSLDNFKIHIELYTPTFEEQSYIWGSLGGKQRPSAVYKVSVIQIESDALQSQGGIITETDQTINQL